ncbi:riboflavin aldehyde-forming enzyme protein [Zalerion maritima]|uniref:Riboflavin aldehyde-forming enzyme protein n=1 Tax=Zalerion maritima TaxID=339359 RepID=A0AAD5RHL9_9PEZI|nr:riboflavin aldehyde-forming enzyme protein [Zalerion maritima]
MTTPSVKDLEAGTPLSREPVPTYQVPDWEGTVRPPPLSRKQSILNSFMSAVAASTTPSTPPAASARDGSSGGMGTSRRSTNDSSSPNFEDRNNQGDGEKRIDDKAVESGILGAGTYSPSRLGLGPKHTFSLRAGTATKKTTPAGGILTSIKNSITPTLDRFLPPRRKYFGRPRKFLLLYILLPVFLVIFLILPLALGLGIGLSSSSSPSNLPLPSSSDVFTGDLTYYSPGLGACGWENGSDDAVAAVSKLLWDAQQEGSNPNSNPLCGKKIRIRRDFVEGGKGMVSVDVEVVDRCVGCEAEDLDTTIKMFTKLANEEQGRVTGSWAWLDE